MKKSSVLVSAKILGGMLFLLQLAMLFVFWNWPLGSGAVRNMLPLYALAVLAAGYPLALYHHRRGALLMLVGTLFFAFAVLTNPRDVPLANKLAGIAILMLPQLSVAFMFYRAAKDV